MKIHTKNIFVKMKADMDFVNITGVLEKILREKNVKNGFLILFVKGSTAAITTIEYEENLVKDVKNAFERLFPSNIVYEHHKTWGDDNGKSHVRASFLKPSLTIPIVNGKLSLGTWQQIVVINFDTRDREREVVVQIISE